MKGVPYIKPNPLGKPLSRQERKVLSYLGQGWKGTDIARTLCVSPKTITVYRTRILDKLGFDNDAQLAVHCYVHHLTDWPFQTPGYARNPSHSRLNNQEAVT